MREGTLDSSALMAVHRIAYYARVSSEQQSKAATIESQLADIRQRLTTDGLVAESAMAFVDDGYSGTSALSKLKIWVDMDDSSPGG